MVKFLRVKETELKAKLDASDKKCERGTDIVGTIEDISVILQPGRFTGGRQDDLMAIRLMGQTADNAVNVINSPLQKICEPGAGNGEDKDEHDADGEERYPKYHGSQTHLKAQKLTILITTGIITLLITFGI
jgi:hypothetical protein